MSDDSLLSELQFLREMGFTHVEGGTTRNLQASERSTESKVEPAASRDPAMSPKRVAKAEPGPGLSWEELETRAKACTSCRLSETRQSVVFGAGNRDADLMFIGEAPGQDEDVQGLPFVGRAGKLLTDIIHAMKLNREEVYIANIIKCRPPGNRNPEADEIEACRPFIRRQVELIRPRVIVTLGKFALQVMMEKALAIGAVRGTWLRSSGIQVMPTYHPAYLLRNPDAKKEVWKDMKLVMAELAKT